MTKKQREQRIVEFTIKVRIPRLFTNVHSCGILYNRKVKTSY